MKFALVGLGFISQRHLDAIKAIGGEIVCACDNDVNQSKWDKMNLYHTNNIFFTNLHSLFFGVIVLIPSNLS